MTAGEKFVGAVATVLLVAVGVLGWRLDRALGRERTAGLQADSLAAALDTSRAVSLSRGDSIRILGDTMAAVTRRALQIDQRTDALDKAMGLNRVALAELQATVRALVTSVTSNQPVVTDSAGTRSASFPIDTTPYRGRVDVELPATGPGRMRLDVRVDTASLGVRLGCGAAGVGGVRSALATVTGPPWLSVALGRVEQDPGICNPLPAKPPLWRRLLSKCGVGPGASLAMIGGALDARPSINAGCWVWP